MPNVCFGANNRSQWREFMKPLLKTNLPAYLDREYPVVRSKLTAENCYHLLPTLEPELQDYFRQKWQYSAENATLQVGGLPRGWGHGFVEDIKKSVMLIQIPTNTLIGLNYGDVSDLIIAIPKADLKRRKFSNVYVDISNLPLAFRKSYASLGKTDLHERLILGVLSR